MKSIKKFFGAGIILVILVFPLISFANSEAGIVANNAHHSDPIAPVLFGLIILECFKIKKPMLGTSVFLIIISI